MAEIYKRPDSKFWWARVKDSTGHVDRISTGTANKRTAQIVADRREGILCASLPPYRLEEALADAHEEQLENKRAASTLDRGRVSGAQLIQTSGGKTDLHAVVPATFASHHLKVRRSEGASDHTISKELTFLRMGLGRAKRQRKFFADPAEFNVPALRGCYTPRDRWLPIEELEALLEAERISCARYSWQVSRRDWLLGYYLTGVRHDELHRIRKEHVDLRKRVVFIDGTKTKKSKREIPIFDDLVPVLERRLDTEGPMLFAPKWQRGRMHDNLKTWCRDAGIAPCSANDFRRSYATLCAERGVDEALTIRHLGHETSAMVRKVYRQVSDRMRENAIERFGSVLQVCSETATPIAKAREYRQNRKVENG